MNSFHVWMFAFFSGVALFAHDGMAEEFSFSHKDWELVCDKNLSQKKRSRIIEQASNKKAKKLSA